jgi:hypothetical protein
VANLVEAAGCELDIEDEEVSNEQEGRNKLQHLCPDIADE